VFEKHKCYFVKSIVRVSLKLNFHKNRKHLVAFTLMLFILVSLSSFVHADQLSASATLSSARSNLLDCYNAAKDAEAAGANVTSLTNVLNEAGASLSNAELAYSKGDFDNAVNLASQSQAKLANFIPNANDLKASGVDHANPEFLVFIGSVVGTFVVIGVGFLMWFVLRRRGKNLGVPER
jgi:hypothetical protein